MTRKKQLDYFIKYHTHITPPKNFILKDLSHSTAKEIVIYVQTGEKDKVVVYYDRQWYNPDQYGFNDKNVTMGIQPGYSFLSDQITRIFKDLETAHIAYLQHKKKADDKAKQDLIDKKKAEIDAVKKTVGCV
jgi:hypothetical protein